MARGARGPRSHEFHMLSPKYSEARRAGDDPSRRRDGSVLADRPASRHVGRAMKKRSVRHVLAALFGVLLALGVSVSAVQAGEMSLQMAMAAEAGASGQGGCDDCAGGDDAGMTCPSALLCSVIAILPAERGMPAATPARSPDRTFRLARGLAAPPDPYPPRLLQLG